MLVKFYGALDYHPVDLVVDNIAQMLSGLQHVYGEELSAILLDNKHHYILQKGDEFIGIHPQMVLSNFSDYESIIIVPDVGGDTGIEVGIAIAGGIGITGVGASVAFAIALSILTSIALSVALGVLMQLLSPTLAFDSDPAQAQKLDSSLFNGAPTIREQGGSVPMCFGNCHAGGVLISAGISSEEKTI
jgi:predicted phage tail protein